MRKNPFAALLLLFCTLSSLAQDKTYAPGSFLLLTTDEQAVIMPCRPDMLISDIDQEIVKRDGMSQKDARETMRLEIAEIVAEQCRVFAMGDVLLPERKNLSSYQQLFRNSTYVERPVPVVESAGARAAKVREILNQAQPEVGTRVENGQLKTVLGKKETFMDLELKADSMVNKVSAQTEYDYLICINELDIRVLRDPAQDVGQDFDRLVKVHYSIFDPQGKKTTAGAASVIYPGIEKGIRPLLDTYFPMVGAQIAAEIAKTEAEAEAETQKSTEKVEEPATTPPKKRPSLKSRLIGTDDDF